VVNLAPDLNNISLDPWDLNTFRENELQATVCRMDKIHPEISGNKWFKLKYYLEKAGRENKRKLISFGGAYSNHLIALAAAADMNGYSSTGMIRGEEPSRLSHTLLAARNYGMELRFLSRTDYTKKKKSVEFIPEEETDPDALLIPEGGAGVEGVKGAEEILSVIPASGYSHICCATGTGTMLAGLINSAGPDQKIIGVSVLKGTRDFGPLNRAWIKNQADLQRVEMIHEYHFGGYAKTVKPLIDFMNRTYQESGIPTDFVYTGKLLFAVAGMAARHAFPAGSRILVLHSGGLQGNLSLAPGLLQF
jgi:1-aminocyclopropane-1-carboxylate deaminase